VDEGASFEALFEEEWGRFALEELGTDAPREELWSRVLLLPGALPVVEDLARSLARFTIPDEALSGDPAYAPAPVEALLGEAIRAARDAAIDLLARTDGMNPKMQDWLSASAELLNAFLQEGGDGMETVASPVPLEIYVEKDPPRPGARLSGARPEEVTAAAKQARALVRRLSKVKEKETALLVEAARPVAARARERLLASGYVSFDALLRLTRDLLADHPEVRRDLISRYRTILVDEFQDTDPLQYEILFFLAEAEGTAERDAYRVEPAPGRLFIVGDPKQSIYRFRGADMAAYQRAVERVIACGGRRLTLTASFRSPSAIVEPVNRLFAPLIGPKERGEERFEPPYEPIRSALGSGDAPGPRVEIWSVRASGDAGERRRGEGDAIAEWIEENRGRTGATGAKLEYKDVAILLRALTNVDLYAQALRRAGIPFVVEGGKGFYERREVADLIAFLRAAANPADAAAILAVARSPLGGVKDAELARYVAAGGRLGRPERDAERLADHPGVRRTLDLLEGFRSRMVGRPADRVIRSALDETPLALIHASCFEGAQRVANLRKVVARAEDLARRGLSLEETLRFIEEEHREERAEGESPLADETVDAVRILSVHKAKGLEYPVVFVPDVGRESRHRGRPSTAAAWVSHPSGGHLAVSLPGGGTNLAWAYLADLNRRHESAEEKRVFYVACTRAAHRLILVNSNADRRAPWREALAHLGYAADKAFPPEGPLADGTVLHRVIAPGAGAPRAAAADLDPKWTEAAERFEEISASAARSATRPIRWPSGAGDERVAAVGDRHEEESATGDERVAAAADRDKEESAFGPLAAGTPTPPTPRSAPTPLPPRGRSAPLTAGARPGTTLTPLVARLAGTAVHAALERWEFKGGDSLKALLETEAARAVESGGAAASEELRRRVLAEAGEIVEGFLRSALPSRLASVEVLGREVPILYRESSEGSPETTWLGACDLLYRDTDGTIVVADYKTDRVKEEAAEEAAKYRDQMSLYLRAVQAAMPNKRTRAEILFVRTGESVPL
jgi:ATP-dependent helicase/nuclease subunit A